MQLNSFFTHSSPMTALCKCSAKSDTDAFCVPSQKITCSHKENELCLDFLQSRARFVSPPHTNNRFLLLLCISGGLGILKVQSHLTVWYFMGYKKISNFTEDDLEKFLKVITSDVERDARVTFEQFICKCSYLLYRHAKRHNIRWIVSIITLNW